MSPNVRGANPADPPLRNWTGFENPMSEELPPNLFQVQNNPQDYLLKKVILKNAKGATTV